MPGSWRRLVVLLLVWIAAVAGGCTKTDEPEAGTDDSAPALDLWAGVPALQGEDADVRTRLTPVPGPAKPPQVGEEIELPFPPPPPSGMAVSDEPVTELEVTNRGPEGAQSIVDSIRVSFNQPMVPLATVEQLRAIDPPLHIDPLPPGAFRWMGTRVVAFQPTGRLPFSTTYKATVPGGVTSTLGKSLAKTVSWEVSTPTLALENGYPWVGSSDTPLDTPIVLIFNQPVRAKELTAAIRLVGGRSEIPLRSIEPADWATKKVPLVDAGAEEWEKSRILVLEPQRALSANTRYRVEIPAGAWGEGPDPAAEIVHAFTTYPPLRLRKGSCERGGCPANDGIALEATTSVDDPRIEERIHVRPAVPDLEIAAWGTSIQLSGRFQGKTSYTVEVDPELTDMHGQTLGRAYSVKIRTGALRPDLNFDPPGMPRAVLEAGASRSMKLRIEGLDEVEIAAYAFGADELPQLLALENDYGDDSDWGKQLPAPTYTKSLSARGSKVARIESALDLDEMRRPNQPFVLVHLRSNKFKEWGWESRRSLRRLVQITDLGISGALDRKGGVVLVTRLSSGEAVAGAKLRLLSRWERRELWSGTTGQDGFAHVEFAQAVPEGVVLIAESGEEQAFHALESDLRGLGTWGLFAARDGVGRAFIYTDRSPYKPGETIHVNGILRRETRGPEGAVESWVSSRSADYVVRSPRGLEVAKGTLEIGPFGTFSVDVPTQEGSDTGNYVFDLTIKSLLGADQQFSEYIAVEEYRAPDFEVEVAREDSTPLFFGGKLEVDVRGRYLHGAPMMNAGVSWELTRSESGFRPPGSENEGFDWDDIGYGGGRWRGWYYQPPAVTVASGASLSLDAHGNHRISHPLLQVEPPRGPQPAGAEVPKPEPTSIRAATFTVNATVVDDNRQAIAGTASFVVHPADRYVGLRSTRTTLQEGQEAELESIVVDLAGTRVSGRPIAVDVVRKDTRRRAVETDGKWHFEYETVEEKVEHCDLVSADTPTICTVRVGRSGTYEATATVHDESGRENRSRTTLFVQGKDAVVWDQDERRVDLVTDKRTYSPGDTAIVMVRSPFQDARGVLVVEREGIKSSEPLVIRGGSARVEIPVTETMVAGVDVSAVLVRGRIDVEGAPPGQDLGMPAVATGTVALEVGIESKQIEVALATSSDTVAPGESVSLTIETRRDGALIPAAAVVMVVDEAVLNLMGHQTPDPTAFFHYKRPGEVALLASHVNVLAREEQPPPTQPLPPDPVAAWAEDATAMPAAEAGMLGLVGTGRGGGGAGEGTIGLGSVGTIGRGAGNGSGSGYGSGKRADRAETKRKAAPNKKASGAPMAARPPRPGSIDANVAMSQPVSLREVFATTAFFDAKVQTDADGKATLDIPMPENLTTFRIMVVAVDPAVEDHFGKGEASVRVRKPIMLRPSLPRFLNYGDRFEGSVMVDNQTDEAQQLLVGVRGLNVGIEGVAEQRIELPAGGSQEVRFAMKTAKVGTMRLQFAALSNGGRDATELSLPVLLPATREAFADYGTTETSVSRLVARPAGVLPDFGGLELSYSSTALNGLEDAVDYLVTYPYECAEQTASRMLPIFALGPILDDFPIATVRDDLRRRLLVREGLDRLAMHQSWDGGFSYWGGGGESWPYLTNWVTFSLLEGKRRGHAIDPQMLDRSLQYLEDFAARGTTSRWGDYYDWTSRAFSLWLLSEQDRGAASFERIYARRGEMPLYARALLMSAAHRYGRQGERDAILAELREAATENARVVHFAEHTSEAAADGLRVLMHSDVQTDAIVLTSLLEVAPDDPLLPKVMAGIMAGRDPQRGGRWPTTHANAWALVAASRYYEKLEAVEPDFVVRAWLGDAFAGEQAFSGRSMTKFNQQVPMSNLLEAADRQELVLAKEGPGRLYYRVGLQYAPSELRLPAEDQGFVAYRAYEAIPEPGQAVADPQAVVQRDDGTWKVAAGTNVRVTITLVVDDRADFVVVDDPLPAGFEGQNERFVTSVAVGGGAGAGAGGMLGGYAKHYGYGYGYGYQDSWWRPWWSFDHVQMKDDRMLLFADHLSAGVYTYSYTARATAVGTFILPPTHAEAMYEPERFGHSASSVVEIVE